MRLLLLLSALLTALTGAIGSRASVAQSTETSACAVVAGGIETARVAPKSVRALPASFHILVVPGVMEPLALSLGIPLYADRLRV